MTRALGIDISHHSGRWDPAAMDPRIRFVLHKATEGASGPGSVDGKYAANRETWESWCSEGVERAGLVWGAYHVLRETSPVRDQAGHFVRVAALQPGDLAALDLETRHIKALVANRGAAHAAVDIYQWCAQVKADTGADPLVYLSERGVRQLAGAEDIALKRPVWWVAYTRVPEAIIASPLSFDPPVSAMLPDGADWLLWQFTSSQPGAWGGCSSEHVDVNVCRDLEALRACCTVPDAPRFTPVGAGRRYSLSDVERCLRGAVEDVGRRRAAPLTAQAVADETLRRLTLEP